MKISPVAAAGPRTINPNEGSATTADKLARAKAVASGQAPEAAPQEPTASTGDAQVDRIKRIKLKTQRSTDRHNRIQDAASTDTAAADVTQQVTDAVVTDPVVADPAANDTLAANEPTQEASDATKPLSPQFAALAKQKRALLLKEQEILAKEKALEAQSTDRKSLEDYRARIKANALSVLMEEGVTYDQLTEQILAEQKNGIDPETLDAKIKAVEQSLEKKLAEREEQAILKQEETYLSNKLTEAEALAQTGDDYSLIRESEAYDRVLRKIYDAYKKTGDPLSLKSAMDQVENELLDERLKWAKLPKVQSRLGSAPQTPPVQHDRPGTKIMKTLTNRDGISSVNMSKRERAIAAMEGRLK